jgi:hypothetical protein
MAGQSLCLLDYPEKLEQSQGESTVAEVLGVILAAMSHLHTCQVPRRYKTLQISIWILQELAKLYKR